MDNPKLRPYPDWETHNLSQPFSHTRIVSPFRIRADRCDRLWVMDTGTEDILGDEIVHAPPQLLVYDLRNDSLLRRFAIPASQRSKESFLASIAVEDNDCLNTFVYLADLFYPAIVVYSWKENASWLIKHHYFHIDPLAGELDVAGLKFQWSSGVFGIALSSADAEGFATLYFHPCVSHNEFAVSTKYLREPTTATRHFHEFKVLGSRGPNGQSSASFLDQVSGVLFYALLNLNAIGCWNTMYAYVRERQGIVYRDDVAMVFPNDVKVDRNGSLWILSDRLPTFIYSKLNETDVNFRIFQGSIQTIINGTVCQN